MSNSQPKQIQDYQLGERIGEGASSKVFKVLNVENGKTYAIKQVNTHNLSESQLESIRMEIHLLKPLSHPNIVKYIDAISTDSHLNIILEYVETGSLATINKKFGPFHETLVAIYIKQVLNGLAYLHSQGVVHRDIKGANILTTKEGIIKLSDFGVAMKLSETTKLMSLVGTPFWMAPEVACPSGPLTSACDIWSLGCTVIELVTGAPPYFDLDPMPALYRMVEDPHPPIPSNVSAELRDFLLKCFQKEPLIRTDAQTLLKHPWVSSKESPIIEEEIPDDVSDTITNTIRHHMESIVEVDKEDSFSKAPYFEEMPLKTGRTVTKSTKMESDDYSLECLQKLRRSRHSLVDQSPFIPMDFNREPKESFKNLIDKLHPDSHNLLTVELQLLDIFKLNPMLKSRTILLNLKSIIEERSEPLILHLSFQLLNLLAENDFDLLESICLLGICSSVIRFTGEEYPRDIRIEAAYLISQLCHSPPPIPKLFLASGGLEGLSKLIDLDFKKNKDLIVSGIDCMFRVIEDTEGDEYLTIWGSEGVIEKLICIIDSVAKDQDYLIKICNLLLLFSTVTPKQGPKNVQLKFCDEDNLELLCNCLTSLPIIAVEKIVECFQYLSNERCTQNKLENAGVVLDLTKVLERENLTDALSLSTLKSLSNLLKLSPAREEQFVLGGGVKSLVKLLDVSKKHQELTLKILSNLPMASPYTLKVCSSERTFCTLIPYIEEYPHLIENIAKWTTSAPSVITEDLAELLALKIAKSEYFRQLLQASNRIIRVSSIFGMALIESEEFVKRLIREVSVITEPMTLKTMLNTLMLLCRVHSAPRAFLDSYNVYPLILSILQKSQDMDLVVVEEIVSILLEIYSNNRSVL